MDLAGLSLNVVCLMVFVGFGVVSFMRQWFLLDDVHIETQDCKGSRFSGEWWPTC